jgi:putative FmdB family regulatory protein
MPIYEYRCSACGSKHEALQKLSDAPLLTCPACHKDALTKLVSAAGFQLKGSGWYVTDFRNGSRPAKSAEAGAKSEGSGEGKADAKPAEGSSTTSTPSETTSGATPAATPAPSAAKSSSQ